MELVKVSLTASNVSELGVRVEELEKRSRRNEDSGDHHHQRSLKGKFLISSPVSSPLSDREGLKEEGKCISSYICELLKKKLGVLAEENDIYSCNHTRKGLAFRFNSMAPNTPFSKTVEAIKGGQGRDITDVYFNFALTPRRASLMYELRQLRKANQIEKCHVDFDGTIVYVKEHNSRKVRVTSLFDNVDKVLYTLNPKELVNSILN